MKTLEQKRIVTIAGAVIMGLGVLSNIFTDAYKESVIVVFFGAAIALVPLLLLLQQNRTAFNDLARALESERLSQSGVPATEEQSEPEPGSPITDALVFSRTGDNQPEPEPEPAVAEWAMVHPDPMQHENAGETLEIDFLPPLAASAVTVPMPVPPSIPAAGAGGLVAEATSLQLPSETGMEDPTWQLSMPTPPSTNSEHTRADPSISTRGPTRVQERIVAALILVAAAALGFTLFQSAKVVALAREANGGGSVTSASGNGSSQIESPELFGAIYDYASVVFPEGVPGCPGDTKLLAWGELEDGWFLVCGYGFEDPTNAVTFMPTLPTDMETTQTKTNSGYTLTSTDVVYDPQLDGYRAYLPEGQQMWLSSVNGVMGLADWDGQSLEQMQLVRYYFVNLTAQKDTERENAYGVAAPDATAEDQVRYLSEIIASSEQARSALGPAVIRVLECEGAQELRDDIDIIRGVRDNRSELIGALAGAPVDQIQGGTLLVNQLTAALSASYDADVAYLAWAEDVERYGCGQPGDEIGDQHSGRAQILKQEFSDNWNATVAPIYDVPVVSKERL